MTMKKNYPITLSRDTNGTIEVSFPDLPWVHTYGDTEEEARAQALEALLTALHFLIKERRPVPLPSRRKGERVDVPAMVTAKVGLHNALLAAGITRAELARRLDMHRPQVDRLFDIDHASTFDQLERACKELGARLELEVVTA